jgi:hypothetical protein
MAAGRPIRIPRHPGTAAGRAEPLSPGPSGVYRENRSGTQRARRLFSVHLVSLAVLFGALLGLVARGPGGLASNTLLLAVLGVIGAAIGAVGWLVTLGQTPRGIWDGDRRLVVHERLGRRREYPPVREVGVSVARRFGAGWLSASPTEIVRLKDPSGHPRTYLLEEGLVPRRTHRVG